MSEAPFAPFVPAILTERLARTGRDVAGPDGWRTAGVALVIDITGFTALTERLAERGPGGAETLASILNESFGDVIERIHAQGGRRRQFRRGDAILAVWPATGDDLSGAVGVGGHLRARGPAPASRPAHRSRGSAFVPGPGSPSATCGSGSSAGSATNGAGSSAGRRWVAPGSAAARARPGELVLTATRPPRAGCAGATVDGDPGHVVIAEVEPRDRST